MWNRWIALIVAVALGAGSAAGQSSAGLQLLNVSSNLTAPPKASPVSYRNPILAKSLADPFILRAGASYYMYATGADEGSTIPIHRSRNLVDWEPVGNAVEPGPPGAWNRKNFWAPEVMERDGRYYLYYTASTDGTPKNKGNRIGVAVADSPEGPFRDRGVVVSHAALDGHPFRDADGAVYLYYTIENGSQDGLMAGQIYVDRLITAERVAGEPVQLVHHHAWQEGPQVLLREGVYFLTYSTGNWGDSDYSVRWATGASARGPFTEQSAVLLESTASVKGPGHHAFFVGPDGQDWIAYHGWDAKFTARYPRIDRLVVSAGTMSTSGPTDGPRAESGGANR